MRYFLLILVCLIGSFCVFMSCTDELPTQPQRIEVGTENTILEAALRTADQFFNQIGAATRSNGRRVGSVHYITPDIQTRAETDTLMILINYEGNQGFAFMPNPKYSYDIYAISPEGTLDYSDFDSNPILRDFYDECKLNALVMAAVAANPNITIPTLPPAPGGEWKEYTVEVSYKSSVNLTATASSWNQLSPYNDSCPVLDRINGTRGVVGCGPLSVGQLLSFYRFPSGLIYAKGNGSVDSCGFQWSNIFSKSRYTAQMLAFLGGERVMNVIYGNDTSGTEFNHKNLDSVVSRLGFDRNIKFAHTDVSDSIDSISKFLCKGKDGFSAAPLIAYGAVRNSESGHMWIIDGVVERVGYAFDGGSPIIGSEKKYPPLFHCVWGYVGGANYNGYYNYDKNKKTIDSVIYQLRKYPESQRYYMIIDSLRKPLRYYQNWKVFGGLKTLPMEYPYNL